MKRLLFLLLVATLSASSSSSSSRRIQGKNEKCSLDDWIKKQSAHSELLDVAHGKFLASVYQPCILIPRLAQAFANDPIFRPVIDGAVSHFVSSFNGTDRDALSRALSLCPLCAEFAGHGLFARHSWDAKRALESCDDAPTKNLVAECRAGIYAETTSCETKCREEPTETKVRSCLYAQASSCAEHVSSCRDLGNPLRAAACVAGFQRDTHALFRRFLATSSSASGFTNKRNVANVTRNEIWEQAIDCHKFCDSLGDELDPHLSEGTRMCKNRALCYPVSDIDRLPDGVWLEAPTHVFDAWLSFIEIAGQVPAAPILTKEDYPFTSLNTR